MGSYATYGPYRTRPKVAAWKTLICSRVTLGQIALHPRPDARPYRPAELQLVGWEYPRVAGGASTPAQTLATAASGLGTTSGMGNYCVTPPAPILVRSVGDLNANGVSGWTGYALQGWLTYLPGGGAQPLIGSVSFGTAVVTWRRTVSPGPAVATFTDVPTSHPLFRFVQALVASGLTGGCTPSTFCPDASITRGQMAVFLSVALGLHFAD